MFHDASDLSVARSYIAGKVITLFLLILMHILLLLNSV